jgi:hypothetical protein
MSGHGISIVYFHKAINFPFPQRLGALRLAVMLVLFQGCSSTSIVVRDHIHALRQDAAPMTITLRDSSRIHSPPYCHVYGMSPDSLRAYTAYDHPTVIGLDDAAIARMEQAFGSSGVREQRQRPDSGTVTLSIGAPALWGKGTHRAVDGRETHWLGAIPTSSILSVELDDNRYVPLAKLRRRMAGKHRVTINDGSELMIDSAVFQKDSCTFFSSAEPRAFRVATANIALVENVFSGEKAVAAMVGGSVAGVLTLGLGSTLLWMAARQPHGEEKLGALYFFIYFGSAGAILGPLLTLTNMHRRYVFAP